MYLFIETIKIRNYKIYNINYHNLRLNRTILDHFGVDKKIDLSKILNSNYKNLTRCRVVYSDNILDIEYSEYTPKVINSISFIESDFNYNYKFLNRDMINKAINSVDSDEVIFIRDGLITDTSIANIAILYNNSWFTPSNPLLLGTTRQRYIDTGYLKEKDITLDIFKKAKKVAFLNSMIDFNLRSKIKY